MTKQPFEKLTAAQKRVMIAKDVIKQIKARRYFVRSGSFLEFYDFGGTLGQKDLRKKTAPVCKVCQIGQAIVSGVRLFNKVELYPISCEEIIAYKIVSRWFNVKNATLMEIAFEGKVHDGRPHLATDEEVEKCLNFYIDRDSGANPSSLSIAIWENVIKNKGTFKP